MRHTSVCVQMKPVEIFFIIIIIISCKFTMYSTNGAISKYVIGNTCAEQSSSNDSPMYTVGYSSSSLWSFKSEGHCRFSLHVKMSGILLRYQEITCARPHAVPGN
jgi:hypothetical protein